MTPTPAIQSRIAYFTRLVRRFRLLLVLLGLSLGVFLHFNYYTMRSDWILMHADSIVVSVRQDLKSARHGDSERVSIKYDYYKLDGIEKAEFVAQFRRNTFGLSDRTYAGIYPFWVYALDAKGHCGGKILVQGTDKNDEGWKDAYDAAVKGEIIDEFAKSREAPDSVFFVRQLCK